MSELEKALDKVSSEYKLKTYAELKSYSSEVQCFVIEHCNKEYSCEVHVLVDKDEVVKVMLECSRNLFLLSFFGKHKYFSMKPSGDIFDIDGSDYWD